ncbi:MULTISPECIES: SH3 domain-containing protein [unclassified Meridianimarinicoccus]|uniref:SH3 domain-containing protein n=1 Tax=unclassified Meridianimarinicoccus TaxID=2923344 RepID=UPI0018666090|nr:SH3 domain-containing protein [Fluviibacterium sp. MJW13]
MGFKLTVLLAMAIFIAFYFAPEPDSGPKPPHVLERAAELQENAPPPVDQAPERSATVTESTPASAPANTSISPDASPDAAPVEETAELPEVSAEELATELAERLPALGLGGLSGSGTAGALALSDSVRARSGTEAGADLTRPSVSGGEVVAVAETDPLPEAEDQPARAQVLGTSVNLRAGPSVSDAVVGRVNFGDEVVLLGEERDGWRSIAHPDTGQPVYMASRFLQPLP